MRKKYCLINTFCKRRTVAPVTVEDDLMVPVWVEGPEVAIPRGTAEAACATCLTGAACSIGVATAIVAVVGVDSLLCNKMF